MAQITTGGVSHIALTVSNVERSKKFYFDLLGFKEVTQLPQGVLSTNGHVTLGLRTAIGEPIPGDRFDPNRIGLDHLSLSVDSHHDLLGAAELFAKNGVECGEIQDLGIGIEVMMAKDPDNIQIELSAPTT